MKLNQFPDSLVAYERIVTQLLTLIFIESFNKKYECKNLIAVFEKSFEKRKRVFFQVSWNFLHVKSGAGHEFRNYFSIQHDKWNLHVFSLNTVQCARRQFNLHHPLSRASGSITRFDSTCTRCKMWKKLFKDALRWWVTNAIYIGRAGRQCILGIYF